MNSGTSRTCDSHDSVRMAAIRSFLWCASTNFCSEILAFLKYCAQAAWRLSFTTWNYHLFSFCRWKGICCHSFVMAYARMLISIDRQKSVCLSHIVQAQVRTLFPLITTISMTQRIITKGTNKPTFPSTQWERALSARPSACIIFRTIYTARAVCSMFYRSTAHFVHKTIEQTITSRGSAVHIWTVFAWSRANVSWARLPWPWVIRCSPVKRTKPSDIFDVGGAHF